MKIIRNNNFILREIAGEYFLIPVGEASIQFNGMITLNCMSAFLWKTLEKEKSEDELVRDILEAFEVEEGQARKDLVDFLECLKRMNMVFEKE